MSCFHFKVLFFIKFLILVGCSHHDFLLIKKTHKETHIETHIDKPLLIKSLSTKKTLHKIAFGSCSHQNGPQGFWQRLEEEKPDLFIHGGDVVYPEKNGGAPALQSAFKKLNKTPFYRKFRKQTPFLAIWDDHDYGLNDGGGEHTWKKKSAQIFLNSLYGSATKAPQHEGLYASYIIGERGRQTQIILLDTRYFRSPLKKTTALTKSQGKYTPDFSLKKTMLGEKQWLWLKGELQKKADLRLIVSSIQVLADTHGYEKWGNFPKEKDKLIELISSTKARRVIFISGDRHVGGIYKKNTKFYPLYEITSSSLNRPTYNSTEKDPQMIHPSVMVPNNYGLIEINWANKQVSVSLKEINTGNTRNTRGTRNTGNTRNTRNTRDKNTKLKEIKTTISFDEIQ